MVLVVRWFFKQYIYFFKEYPDARSQSLPLMQSPIPILMILGFYLYFIKSLGPRLMRDRKPFDLQNLMTAYNIFQVVINFTLASYALSISYLGTYSLRCQSTNTNSDWHGYIEVYLTYAYFWLKIIDLLDTIFFVLRKKWNQITFLHLYHHTGICFGGWLTTKFFPGGHVTLLGIINSYIHVIMYFYYFLTAFKPELKKSLWWKKYITQLQLIQFGILTIHFFGPLLFPVEGCTCPKLVLFLGGTQNCYMMLMFADFYYKAYLRKKPNEAENGKVKFDNGSPKTK